MIRLQRQQVLELLADLLDYPCGDLAGRAVAAEQVALGVAPAAVPYLRSFREFAERTPSERLEEIYSALFDLNPVFYPYVGYQLFGETYRRSLFLVALKERYRERGFELATSELPDRLAVLLRFAAANEDEADVLVTEALIPALRRMLRNPEETVGQPPEEAVGGAAAELQQTAPYGRAENLAARGRMPGASRNELEGHSHGEILKGGILLTLTEGGSVLSPSRGRIAYECLLHAARLLLEALWGPGGPRTAVNDAPLGLEEKG